MNTGAGVESFQALTDWHACLTEFRTDAQNAVTAVALSLQRAADWVADQQKHWRAEIRKTEDRIVEAKTALRNKQYEDYSGGHPDTTVEEKELREAVAYHEFAQEQHDTARRWSLKLPTLIEDAWLGPSRNLTFFLDSDLPRAMALLTRQIAALEQYAATTPPTT